MTMDKNDTDYLKPVLGDGDKLTNQETQCSTSYAYIEAHPDMGVCNRAELVRVSG